jgi:hypothetical protein
MGSISNWLEAVALPRNDTHQHVLFVRINIQSQNPLRFDESICIIYRRPTGR